MRKFTNLLFISLFASSLFAQRSAGIMEQPRLTSTQSTQSHKVHRCSTMENDAKLRAAHPEMGTLNDFENWMGQAISDLPTNSANKTSVVKIIPTIVHVIHNGTAVGSGFNLSQAQVNSQFTILNQDFRRTNPDASSTPSVFLNAAVDCEVQFCPALVDPQGNLLAEPGIDRINRNSKGWIASGANGYSDTYVDGTIKPNSIWDPTKYCNIWVLDLDNQLLGYAQFPTGSGLQGLGGTATANTDGVVITATAFGNTGTAAFPYNKGRTTTHEVGHWLGLRHIWGDGTCATDYCADTPPAETANYFPSSGANCFTHPYNIGGCSGNTTGEMFMNYMDYTNDACMNLFTTNQKTRMDAVLANSPRRASLVTSNACSQPSSVVANYTTSPSQLCIGSPVQFTFTGTVPSGTTPTYSWTFTGGTPATSTAANPSVTYASAGNFAVALTVTANGTSDTKNGTVAIVNCQGGTTTCDTLTNLAAVPVDSITVYSFAPTDTTWGYVSGHNMYGDLAKADYFNYTPALPAQITDVSFIFYKAVGAAPNNTLTVKVWADNAGTPGAVLGSTTIPYSSIVTNTTTTVTFPTPINLTTSGKFYAGIEFVYGTTSCDTVALWLAKQGLVNPGTAWDKWSDNTWHKFSDTNNWSLNTSMTIFPTVCRTTSAINTPLEGDIKLYPNPSDGSFTLEIANSKTDEVAMFLYDLQGKQIFTENISTQYGSVKKDFAFSNLAEGSYIVRLLSNGKYANYKLLIQK